MPMLQVSTLNEATHQEETRDDSETGFCLPQLYHTIPASRNRYEKRHKLSDIANLHLRDALFP
jgi:hypothetical protein